MNRFMHQRGKRSMKMNNNDEQHKMMSFLGKNIVKATVFIVVSLFILGYLHFVSFEIFFIWLFFLMHDELMTLSYLNLS